MPAGRPQKAHPGTLYTFAHQFYWEFRSLAEGTSRWKVDREKYEKLTQDADSKSFIDDEDRARHRHKVEEEIRNGVLESDHTEERLREIADAETLARREWFRREAIDEARKEIKFRGEKDVVEVLLNPNSTPDDIRDICKEAFMTQSVTIGSETREVEIPAWPISVGSTLPTYLSQYADQYIAALRDPRFPKCDVADRPSTRLKQFWFLSRALAGALYGVTARTAINLVGSLRPEQMFANSRYAKPTRTRRKTKI